MNWLTRHNLAHWYAQEHDDYIAKPKQFDGLTDCAWGLFQPAPPLHIPQAVRETTGVIIAFHTPSWSWLSEEELGF